MTDAPDIRIDPLTGDKVVITAARQHRPNEGPGATGSWPGWQAEVPAAATWPFARRLAPVPHRPDLPSLGDEERDDFASLLVDVRNA